MRLHLSIMLLVLLPMGLAAQSAKWEGGFLAGGAGYQGDLVSKLLPDFQEVGSEYSLLLRKGLSSTFGWRFMASYATYSGEDDILQRGFAFSGTALNVSTQVEWEPLAGYRYPAPYQFNPIFSPYLFAGLGVGYYDVAADFPSTDDEALLLKIKSDQAHADPLIRPVVPIGLGVKIDLSRRFAVRVEAGTQTAFTDHLDAISESANPGANDWLAFARAGLAIRFLPKDSDRDGIADIDDACPDIEGAWTAAGCPDTDEDGVENLEDLCPEIAGSAALNGCPDRDGDGIADHLDRCPYEKGTSSASGCPDWDQDGLSDVDDSCPRLPGLKARSGCPVLDTDADGEILDERTPCIPSFFARQLESIDSELKITVRLIEGLRFHSAEKDQMAPLSEFDF